MEVSSPVEFQVLSIIRERFSYIKHGYRLREDLFESPQTRFLFRMISNFHDNHNTNNITIRSLKALLHSSLKPDDRAAYRGILLKIKRAAIVDPSVKDAVIRKFTKTALLRHAILDAIDSLEHDEEADLERVRQKLDEAILVDKKGSDESYDYFKDPFQRVYDENKEKRLKTGISWEIDRALSGGLAAGEIGLIIAPTGVGKTLTLVNIGYEGLLQGKKVVHATLEISPRKVARRYDVRICGASWADIRTNPEFVRKRVKVFQTAGAGLHIKDYTANLCSVQDLRAYLERLRSEKFKFDVVLVDHADLMYAPKQYKERRYELSSIVAGLRRLASEFRVPIWTASQATRKAGELGRTRLWDIAEDIGKANWADAAITISQTEEDKNEGIAHLKVAKSRMDKDNPLIKVMIDYDTMKMWGIKQEVKDIVKKQPKSG